MIRLWKHTSHSESQETKCEITKTTYELFCVGLWQIFVGDEVVINVESVSCFAYTE